MDIEKYRLKSISLNAYNHVIRKKRRNVEIPEILRYSFPNLNFKNKHTLKTYRLNDLYENSIDLKKFEEDVFIVFSNYGNWEFEKYASISYGDRGSKSNYRIDDGLCIKLKSSEIYSLTEIINRRAYDRETRFRIFNLR